ncbi:MAG: hypothetical protein ACJ8J0_03805, partial [Longimicrobiaceae bacterium]
MQSSHRLVRTLAVILAVAGCATAAGPSGAAPAAAPAHGIDVAAMDTTCRACEDFYRYANGRWLDRNPIPPDQDFWTAYHEAGERTLATLRDI